MDPLTVLPPELGLRLLGLLGPADLCRCLAVSSRWRLIADSDSLWRPFCLRSSLQPDSPPPDEGPLPLCRWARTYIGHMRRLVGNWRTDSYQSFQLEKEDWFCCISCRGPLLAVYYPRPAQVRLYLVEREVELLCSLPVLLPGGTAIPDVAVGERRLVLSRGNTVLVYGLEGRDFGRCAAVVRTGEGLLLLGEEAVGLGAADHPRLYLKLLAGDRLWLEAECVFIVDMAANTFRVLEDTFRCLRSDGERVFAANDQVSVFSLSGELQSQLAIRGVADMWVAEDLLAVLLGTEQLEVWRVSSRTRLHSRRVLKDPSLHLGPAAMFLLEYGEGGLRLSSIAPETGRQLWVYENRFTRELVLHPEIRLLCERFVFVRPSHTKDENFLLVDAKSGKVLYDSVMPPSLSPPSYIYHLSDEMFITAESNVIHIRRTMIQRMALGRGLGED